MFVWGGVAMCAEYLVNHTKENVCESSPNRIKSVLLDFAVESPYETERCVSTCPCE